MRELQAKIIEELGVRPEIDAAEEIRRRIDFLKDYLAATGAKGFVLGISGGIDSTLAGRLAQLAVEEVREAGGNARFVAARLPHGNSATPPTPRPRWILWLPTSSSKLISKSLSPLSTKPWLMPATRH